MQVVAVKYEAGPAGVLKCFSEGEEEPAVPLELVLLLLLLILFILLFELLLFLICRILSLFRGGGSIVFLFCAEGEFLLTVKGRPSSIERGSAPYLVQMLCYLAKQHLLFN